MATRPTGDELHQAFLDAIAGGTVVHVSLFDPTSFVVPDELPDGIGVGRDDLIDPVAGYQLVLPVDHPLLLEQQDHIQAKGRTECWVRFVSGTEGPVRMFDLSKRFGLQALVMDEQVRSTSAHQDELRHADLVARIGRWKVDTAGGVISVDESLTRMTGWTAEQLTEIGPIEPLHPEDRNAVVQAWASTLSEPGASGRARSRFRRADGSWQWVEITFENHLADAGDHSIHVEILDISAEMAAADELRARERLLHRLAEALPVGVVQIDADQRVVYTNAAIARITGREGVETFAEQLQDATDDDRTLAAQAIEQVLGTGVDGDIEINLVHKLTGEHRICGLTLRALTEDDGAITGAIVCVTDVTDSASRRHELEVAATFDTLTGTYNRTSCLAALEAALQRAQPDAGCAVVFIDLDGFKAINDTLGHIAGDELLVETAQRLRAATRSADVVGRFGGDEFVVVCTDVADAAMATELANRISRRLEQPAFVSGRSVDAGASIGVAWADGDVSAEELLRQADVAMYVAKRDPSAGVHLYAGTPGPDA